MDPAAPRAGSVADFTAFYDATWKRTVAVAYAMTGELSAAADLAKEAYSWAWPRWSTLRSYDDPGAWVRQVTGRLAVSRWRRTKTAMSFLARSRMPDPAKPPDETSIVLVQALRMLPEAQRRALVLHHLGELPAAEVAADRDALLLGEPAHVRSRDLCDDHRRDLRRLVHRVAAGPVDGGLPCATLAASPTVPTATSGSGSMPGSGGVTLFSYRWATDDEASAARDSCCRICARATQLSGRSRGPHPTRGWPPRRPAPV